MAGDDGLDYYEALQYDLGIVVGCERCQLHAGPSHYNASPRCRSGRGAHCSCDTCY